MPFVMGYAVMEAARQEASQNPRPPVEDSGSANEIKIVQPVEIPGKSLGELLKNYCQQYDLKITPAKGFIDETSKEPKYWQYIGNHDFFGVDGEIIIDIHVTRDGKMICPKQDLDFPLIETDLIDIPAMLAC